MHDDSLKTAAELLALPYSQEDTHSLGDGALTPVI